VWNQAKKANHCLLFVHKKNANFRFVEIVKVKVRQVKTARQLTIDRGRFHYDDYSHYQRRWLPRLHTCWPSSVAFVKDLLKHQQSTGNNQHSQYHSTAHQICSLLPRRNSKLSDFCYFSDSFFFFIFFVLLLFCYFCIQFSFSPASFWLGSDETSFAL